MGIFVFPRGNFEYKLSLNLRKHCPLSEQLSKAMKRNSDYTLQSNGKHLHVLRVKRHIRGFVRRPFWPRSGVGSYHSARAIRHYESRVYLTRNQWALCSWGHVTTIFLKIFYTMGYNLKNARNGKSISKIPKWQSLRSLALKNEILWWFEFQKK